MKKKIAIVLVFALIISLFTIQGNKVVEVQGEKQNTDNINKLEIPQGSLLYSAEEISVEEVSSKNRVSYSVNTTSEDGNELEATFDEASAKFGAVLNEQMENYLTDGSGTQPTVTDCSATEDVYITSYKFSFSDDYLSYPLPNTSSDARGQRILRWLFQGIANYPNLCTFNTSIGYSTVTSEGNYYLKTITVYSAIAIGEAKSTINEYKTELDKLVSVPKQDSTMTDEEKLFYLYNEIAALCTYPSSNLSTPSYHMPIGLLLDHKAVCQAYAAVFNQGALELGLNSVYMVSSSHAWNAVRLNDDWYYVDTTWADPTNGTISMVVKDYFLTDAMTDNTAYATSHTLDSGMEYDTTYASILEDFGTAYKTYYPKENSIYGQMSYFNGNWYYAENGSVYYWDGESTKSTKMEDIETDSYRQCDASGNYLYYSGSDGFFQYHTQGESAQLSDIAMTNMVIQSDEVYYENDSVLSRLKLAELLGEESVTTPTPAPTAEPTATPTVTKSPEMTSTATPTAIPSPTPTATPTVAPTEKTSETYFFQEESEEIEEDTLSFRVKIGKGAIKTLKNYAKKKIRCKIKKVSGATGYQIYYATNKKFKKKKKRNVKKTTFVLKKLKKKKTYYVKVRAYYEKNGKKTYSKWSKVKKVKIRK